jgi:hypothetical protein
MSLYSSQEQIIAGQKPRVNTPMLWINKYLQEKIAENLKIAVPIFPTMPSSLDNIQDYFLKINNVNYEYTGVIAVYDRMFKVRRSPFPHVKCEELMYYFYATDSNVTDYMVAIAETILRLFDGEDESAQDFNEWFNGKTINLNGKTMKPEFFFHVFKAYQLEESRDIATFQSTRTYGASKLILSYDYHRVSIEQQTS